MINNEIKFLATNINCYTEDQVLIIGISNDLIFPNNYLILSRFDEDEGDVDESIGIQTHLTEIEVAKAVKSIVLKKNTLTIEINKHKTEQIQAKKIIIEFNELDNTLLIKYINDIFSDSSATVIINV
ncbi:MAG: hypothetical protein J6569_06010 [Gilliamella sp.]|uniref:hypothetical protein n=1 Tax=unclassified Gilliamella TaxID=2685620 RepID=UPI00080DCAA0|nr:hypothetical protein [Gilliamella apicola]MCO6539671.1 hypothetical protein [Gilliamella sp.]NUE95051.1 hypothetical protein [Gilliamella sp. ESL0232]OCG55070.1 hypothetical protein A9G27_00005 [Gilliamella apicola]